MRDNDYNFDADLLILGAGPAGLSAAQYGSRANLRVLVVEEMAPGGQALNIEVLENYPGNVARDGMPPRGGFEFCEDLRKQAESFGAAFIMEGAVALVREKPDAAAFTETSATAFAETSATAFAETSAAAFAETSVKASPGGTGSFAVTLSGGRILRAPVVILATGAKHRTLDIPGEKDFEGRGVSYCATCDGPFFKGKRILVVGGGDSACDEALYLSRLSGQITLVHRKSMFRAQKSLADRVLSNPNIKVRFNTRLVEIRGEGKVGSVILEGPEPRGTADSGGTFGYEEPMDAVFIFVGSIPKTDLVRDMARLDQSGYVVTDQSMATSAPGLYAAGDVRSSPFRQVVVAAGEGAVAAHCAAAYIDSLRGEVYH